MGGADDTPFTGRGCERAEPRPWGGRSPPFHTPPFHTPPSHSPSRPMHSNGHSQPVPFAPVPFAPVPFAVGAVHSQRSFTARTWRSAAAARTRQQARQTSTPVFTPVLTPVFTPVFTRLHARPRLRSRTPRLAPNHPFTGATVIHSVVHSGHSQDGHPARARHGAGCEHARGVKHPICDATCARGRRPTFTRARSRRAFTARVHSSRGGRPRPSPCLIWAASPRHPSGPPH